MVRLTALALLIVASTAALGQEPIFAKVLSCYDGDTCRLEREVLPGRDQFHLANADTPEIEGKCAAEKQRAIEARDYTRSMVVGRVVSLLVVRPDKYRKRLDAYISVDGRDLRSALIAAGLARPYGQRAGWCD